MDDPTPPTTSEPWTPLDDPQLQFFLEHQEQIFEWAELAPKVHEAVGEALRTIGLDVSVDQRVTALGNTISDRVHGESTTGPVLFRESWRISNDVDPDVGIALGWDGRVDPAGIWPRATPPYTGILTSHHSEEGRAIESSLRQLSTSDLGGGSGSPHPRVRGGSYWIVYRPIRSETDWWRDVAGWRRQLVDQLVVDWGLWAEQVERAVQTVPAGPVVRADPVTLTSARGSSRAARPSREGQSDAGQVSQPKSERTG